jgi:hypothetical protein
MVIYFAEIDGVRAAVDPTHLVLVGYRVRGGLRRPNVSTAEWIGRRTWREVAEDLADRELVTRAHDGSIVSLKCVRDDSLGAESDEPPLSSAEKKLVLEVLRESGRPDLAERADPILERATKTDPPPPATSTPAKGRP